MLDWKGLIWSDIKSRHLLIQTLISTFCAEAPNALRFLSSNSLDRSLTVEKMKFCDFKDIPERRKSLALPFESFSMNDPEMTRV
jgi:hypothetical protein